jgi:hypothetical protein
MEPIKAWRGGIASVFVAVGVASLAGMIMGGLFGLAAGILSPSFFLHFLPWQDVEPIGFAVVLGAFGGVLCGGSLGVFAVLVQFLTSWLAGRKNNDG